MPVQKKYMAVCLVYLVFGSLWIIGSDFFLAAITSTSADWSLLQTAKGCLFVCVTTLFLYLLLRSSHVSSKVKYLLDKFPDQSAKVVSVRTPLALFVLFSLMLGAAGYLVFDQLGHSARRHAQESLEAMARMEVANIQAWRKDRHDDAAGLAADPQLLSLVRQWSNAGGREQGQELLKNQLERVLKVYRYDALVLYDAASGVEFRVPTINHFDYDVDKAQDALRQGKILFSDLLRSGPDQTCFVDLYVPLIDKANPKAFRLLVLRFAPRGGLFSLLSMWPEHMQGSTMESLLLQRRGNQIVYLNPQHSPASNPEALRLSKEGSLSVELWPVNGEEGMFRGFDYRQMPILAAVCQIPASSWFVVVKMDENEVVASLRQVGLVSAALLLVMLGSAGVGLGLWWRQQRSGILVERLEGQLAQQVLKKRYEYLVRYANDIMLLVDEQGCIVECNERAVSMYGYARETLLQMNIVELRSPKAAGDYAPALDEPEGDGRIFETLHMRCNGTEFPVEVSSRLVEIGPQVFRQSIIRDISERIQAQEKIGRLTRMYNVLSHTNQAIVRARDRAGLFDEVCQTAVEQGQLCMAVINIIATDDDAVVPVAFCSKNTSFVGDAGLTLNGASLREDLTQVVLREDRRYICNDLGGPPFNDGLIFSEQLFPFGSLAFFPLHCSGKLVGTLNLFAAEKDFFGTDLISVLDEMAVDISFALGNFEVASRGRSFEKQLKETTGKFQALFTAAPLAAIALDLDGHVMKWNPAAEQVFGWTEQEVVGRRLPLVPDDKQVVFLEHLSKAKKGESIDGIEVRRHRRDGSLVDLLLYTSPLHDQQGTMSGMMAIFVDIAERKRSEEKIIYLAHHDQLTGLPNRSLIRERFDTAAVHAVRSAGKMALCMLDLDRFKNINDTLGHHGGDHVLKMVASRLSKIVRSGDTVCRTGGDEFVLLFPDVQEPDHLSAVAKKILGIFDEPFEVGGHVLKMSGSMGVSMFPEDGQEYDEIFKNADAAMYFAKEQGRNNFQFFQQELTDRIRERLALEDGMRQALSKNAFELYFQPQVDTVSANMDGMEALLRWNHPEWGMVPPSHFIPVAEETGLIVPLGRWVIEEACRHIHKWETQGRTGFSVAVNLSPVQLFRDNLPEVVASALKRYAVEPQRLELELTESIFLEDIQRVEEALLRLKQIGVRLSLDDFGKGYSSLNYLKRFRIDKLKIDKSFVGDICTDANDAAIVRAIVNIGHTLGMTVLAEGVETPEQLEFLRQNDCDMCQGYYFGRPVPADEIFKMA